MKLLIGNKLFSSWSLRPWLLMKVLDVPFEEVVIPLDRPDTREKILRHAPAGRVPVLVDGEATAWESLAIMDYVATFHAPGRVWPEGRAAQAMARAVAAEMHAGFVALRANCPMNLGMRFPARDRGEAVAADVARVEAIVRDARARFGVGGPFLFGAFSAADAMYAPVATRLDTYGIPVEPETAAWMDAVLGLPAYREWLEAALAEPWPIPDKDLREEPESVLRAGLEERRG
jgi:glutathione S-transferase